MVDRMATTIWVETRDMFEVDDKDTVRARRKKGENQRPTTFDPATSLFSSRHIPEDVRFGGVGCCDVARLVGEKVKKCGSTQITQILVKIKINQ